MELKIDTEKDSKENIKRVIKLLQQIVGEPTETTPTMNEPTYKEREPTRFSETTNYPNHYEERRSYYEREPERTTRDYKTQYEEPKKDYNAPSEGLFDIFNSSNKDEDDFSTNKNEEEIEKKEEKKKVNLVPY